MLGSQSEATWDERWELGPDSSITGGDHKAPDVFVPENLTSLQTEGWTSATWTLRRTPLSAASMT